ncbi:hypothetical protein GCM10008098_11960 [Rhodanobacter panaciterrae]|uniref:Uncharacterized protein n=1 Tax=Rhodanobacter panaciterrae TaxID=490572 RepID=A0ABQ2ZRN9_9GAMM|nr:hypothetical protein [Rhodanobacter panaciterrae]GGY20900.1 hypothetical protein GCM10008098_11960 [Rhodanobacter panaciterrae]
MQGIVVCADSGTGSNGEGTIPPGCSSVTGVIVCGDGNVGGSGSVCVTQQGSTNQSCLTGIGGFTAAARGRLGVGLGVVKGLPAQITSSGWLSRITGWLAYAFNVFFAAIAQFFKDLVTYVLAAVLGLVALAISSIPVPDWIANNSMGNLLGQAGPIAGFFMVKLQIPAALVLIGAGYAFRLMRKFLTLFQW